MNMEKLFSILKKPNRLDELADGPGADRPWFWEDVRKQIRILHWLGRCYVITVCLTINFSSIYLGLPLVFEESPGKLLAMQILMAYTCFCIITNFVFISYFADKSHFGFSNSANLPFNETKKMKQPDWTAGNGDSAENSVKGSDWWKCTHCDILVPPRARHCSICRTCVLKKDHHCFFTGCCIGFYNQRYFITFCIFGMLGGTWGMYNLSTYLSVNYAPFLSLQIYKYFLPYCVIATMFGYMTLFEAAMILMFYSHATSTLTSFYYFIWQCIVIYRGQTSYEFMKKRRIFSADLAYNLQSIFGPYWAVGFFIPVPFLLNEGDGTTWDRRRKTL